MTTEIDLAIWYRIGLYDQCHAIMALLGAQNVTLPRAHEDVMTTLRVQQKYRNAYLWNDCYTDNAV